MEFIKMYYNDKNKSQLMQVEVSSLPTITTTKRIDNRSICI